jgi:hypothetical protein
LSASMMLNAIRLLSSENIRILLLPAFRACARRCKSSRNSQNFAIAEF